ncbi:interleukin-13 receptor subunit alpha-1 [Cottoperca gobio]|uniref:Interleukin-13 receptor subunit alpha-1 n=1 Tax=Cottoperca gobio TaxID=56716 RepID=A0A6J2RJA6_COTGO|nr:interleukin-13 receptor subunit alpha-1-like [Cottoperca gobio]
MTGMFQSLDLFFLSCLILTVESQQGQISPPQNVSLRWMNDFEIELSWAPPQHPMENCKYIVTAETKERYSKEKNTLNTSPWLLDIVMEGGFLNLTVNRDCNGTSSEKVIIQTNYTELVSDLQCFIHSDRQTRCSWRPASNASDLKFFYLLISRAGVSSIQECSSYRYTDGIRMDCDLEADVRQLIHILFNGTVNNTRTRNTFEKKPSQDVRPPALKWNVIKKGDRFNISWTPPNIRVPWTYNITYIECNETKYKEAEDGKTSTVLDLVPQCPYRINIRAENKYGNSPWSNEMSFDADTDPEVWLYAAIVIPLMFAGLAVLTFMCCKKNKKYIFPKVPEPLDLLSDISDNNNKSFVHNMYVPAEEEENFKITLVTDPQINFEET